MKNKSKLTKKVITDKKGKRTTVLVNLNKKGNDGWGGISDKKKKEFLQGTAKDGFIRAKQMWNDASGDKEKQKKIAVVLDKRLAELVKTGVKKESNITPFWRK